MKNIKSLLMASVFSLTVVFSAVAGQEQNNPKPGGAIVNVTELSGEVTAIDYEKKMVTLKGPEGNVVTLNAKNAQNLDQVKVGDAVNAKFVESLAVFVRKADAPPSADEAQTVAFSPKGEMPAGVVAQTTQITANVEAIDYQKRTVTLKGPEGGVRTIKVGDTVKRLEDVKVGNQVVVRVTEALALGVTKP